jgi:Transposase
MSVYVGIDVHRKRSQVVVVAEDGQVQVNRNVPNGVQPVLKLIGGLPAGTPVAFEAAYGWGWLVELLEDYGFAPHMVHPLRCKAIASARLKNDKVDAATLAQLLRADLLPEAWIAPGQVRQLRALLRHRVALVRLCTGLRNRIHAVVADHGHDRPDAHWTGAYWTGPGRAWLAGLPLPAVSRQVVTDSLAIGAHVVDQIVRPIGSGTRLTGNLDLRDVSFVFPLAAIPEWIAGRIFYRFLGEALQWIFILFVIANVGHAFLIWLGSSDEQRATTRTILGEVAYDIGLLVLVFAVVFLAGRRTARRAISLLALRLTSASSGSEPTRIRGALLHDEPLPMAAGGVTPRNVAVFVSGHTHAPSSSQLLRDDETMTAIVNTGCWLRQLHPVPARFGAPHVFVPMFVQTHVRVQRSQKGVAVELWDRPKSAPRTLPWIERAAIAARMPNNPQSPTTPRLLDRQLIDSRTRAST